MDISTNVSTIEQLVQELKDKQCVISTPKRIRRKPPSGSKRYGKSSFSETSYIKKLARDRATWAGVSGAWKHLRKTYNSRARARGEESKWLITLEQWKKLWEEAGFIRLTNGKAVTVFQLRGKTLNASRVYRIDGEKPWELSNMVVMYQGAVRANGRALSKELAEG